MADAKRFASSPGGAKGDAGNPVRHSISVATPRRCTRYSRRVQAICGQLDSLNRSISDYDAEIKKLVKTHADYAVVASLPGASHKSQARIIAALGDDRSRYADAAGLQAAAGQTAQRALAYKWMRIIYRFGNSARRTMTRDMWNA